MTSTANIECVFYSHCWGLYCLDQLGIKTNEETILIELSRKSTLGLMLGDSSKHNMGIASLLDPETGLDSQIRHYDELPVGIILASNQELPIATLSAAAGVIRFKKTRAKRIILLVNVLDAVELAPIWQHADSFRVFWDIADQPDQTLVNIGDVLAGIGCLNSITWKGITFYQNQKRPNPEATILLDRYQHILNEYPALLGTA
jgi:hypothetical protein